MLIIPLIEYVNGIMSKLLLSLEWREGRLD